MHSESPELWAAIGGYPAYLVSTLGNVRSGITERTLKPRPRKNGYISVALLAPDGRQRRHYVHRLVAQAFLGDCSGLQVNHINFVRHDNRVTNLEIVTCAQNAAHSRAHGRLAVLGKNTPRGELSCHSKLKAHEVAEMRQLFKTGTRKAELSRLFGVTKTQVANVVHERSWKPDALQSL